MITVEEHLSRILGAVRPLPVREVPLLESRGTLLAADVTATLAVPPFDNSAMDGFAVRCADVEHASAERPVTLTVIGDIPAGARELPAVASGEAARIMTGAPMPPGADGVVKVEDTDQAAGPAGGRELPSAVRIVAPARERIRRRGEDLDPGDPVLRAGIFIGPRAIAAAASTGHAVLPVRPRPRVGVLATGDELTDPGLTPGPGQIPDSNSVLLLSLLEVLGATPVPMGRVGDEPAELRALLSTRLGEIDALITTGGVSAGTYDVVKEALSERGGVEFVAVAMQPGKPQGFGELSDGERTVPIFCLPGNPVSVFVSVMVLVTPALEVLSGWADGGPPEPFLVDAVAAEGWRCPPGRRQYLPVTLEIPEAGDTADKVGRDVGEELLRVRPVSGSGSHLVASLARAEALAVIESDVEQIEPGDAVRVMMVP